MPFDTGQQDLFNFNHVDFDFNIQFEQLFFSIVPSVIFIVASSWRAASQLREPTLVKAPIFQSIKLVSENITAIPARTTDTSIPGYYRYLFGSRAGTSSTRIALQIPGFKHVSGGVSPQASGCLDNDYSQSCGSQQKSATICLARYLSFVDTSTGCGSSKDVLPVLERCSGSYI